MNLYDILLARKLGGGGTQPSLGTKSITANGTYAASSDDLDGYSEVTVNVSNIPNKGFVFKDYDVDGYPQTVDAVGYDAALPGYYLNAYSTRSNLLTNIKTINIYGAIYSGQHTFQSLKITAINVYSNSFTYDTAVLSGCNELKTVYNSGNVLLAVQCFQGASNVEKYDFSNCTNIPSLGHVVYLGHANGCVIKIPSALSDTTLGVGNGWESATNWVDLTDVVWEVV